MSDQNMRIEVSTLPSFTKAQPNISPRQPGKDYQMAEPKLPSDEVLLEIGRAVVRFGQLEHLLKLLYKRTDQKILLQAALKLKVTLGGLLTGAKDLGERMQFEGLLNLATENPQLDSIRVQLNQAHGLVETRNKYVHNGIGITSNNKFIFLNSGEELEESEMIKELVKASNLTAILMGEMNKKIPAPR